MPTSSEQPAADGTVLFATAITAVLTAAEQSEDVDLQRRVQFLMHDVRELAAYIVDAARAEGTAMAVLPGLVERGSATAMPLAEFDKAVNDILLQVGDDEHSTRAALQRLKDTARSVLGTEAELCRQRIERLGGAQAALRLLTPGLVGKHPRPDGQPE